MPELPEVEAVRLGLEQLVIGKKIEDVHVYWPKIINETDELPLRESLLGEEVEAIHRRGKFLIFDFTHYQLLSHLRMEGKYEVHSRKERPTKHTHVVFEFTDGTALWYLDVRKFGRMTLTQKGMALEQKNVKILGPEPLTADFILEEFANQLATHTQAIKPLLLNQRLVVGLGNIYVDEALFEAKIHPLQPANSLSKPAVKRLHTSIRTTLSKAVEAGGSTIRTYKNALGEAGKFQIQLQVYGQTGEPCRRCGTPIAKIKVAQRGTHFCPNCQRLHH